MSSSGRGPRFRTARPLSRTGRGDRTRNVRKVRRSTGATRPDDKRGLLGHIVPGSDLERGRGPDSGTGPRKERIVKLIDIRDRLASSKKINF